MLKEDLEMMHAAAQDDKTETEASPPNSPIPTSNNKHSDADNESLVD